MGSESGARSKEPLDTHGALGVVSANPMGIAEQIPPRQSTQQKLRAALAHREWGVRTLAREMAHTGDPNRIETIRGMLKRYLRATNPVNPSVATLHAMEDALGVERGSLQGDAEDEEAAELMADLMPLARAFNDLVDRKAEEKIDARIAEALRAAGLTAA